MTRFAEEFIGPARMAAARDSRWRPGMPTKTPAEGWGPEAGKPRPRQAQTLTVQPTALTLKVRMPPLYTARLRATAWIIGLAGWVAGPVANIVIETE